MKLTNDWSDLLKQEMDKIYFRNLISFLNREYITKSVLPEKENIFRALNLTPYKKVKCLILGQDPYPTKGDACGLAFSSNRIPIPRSLNSIFKELNRDLQIASPANGDLTKWAEQGVLLLNSILTVVEGARNSHAKHGWETFTNRIISLLNERETPIVFMLWGNEAKKKKTFITNPIHLIIESSHPSPLGSYNGFEGSRPFSRCNNFLEKYTTPIDWELTDFREEELDGMLDITNMNFDIKLSGDKATVTTKKGTYLYDINKKGKFIVLTGEGLIPLKTLNKT